MHTHLAYRRSGFRKPADCIAGLREHVAQGWTVTAIEGPPNGPFAVTLRKEEPEPANTDPSHA